MLDEIRQNKPAFLSHLRYRDFVEVPPAEGDPYTVTFEGECDMKRWAVAVQAGLIHLTAKVQAARQSGRCKISFRCNQPLEWLQDAITAASKQEYNKVLGRIEAGTAWLKDNEGSPEYDRAYDLFLALYEELRLLYVAIGEPLDDPMRGWQVE
ncbi:hypothetical protein LJC74_03995 [Eubacteriales bacterium OttesenSCG-928-A19]|nr:hypothetical protein [Eubacteriales bacterium OttesenSCG-928-A19]